MDYNLVEKFLTRLRVQRLPPKRHQKADGFEP